MTCPRCQGLMVSATLEDAKSTLSREPLRAWRCLLCGEVLDPTIAQHRKGPPKPPPGRPHARLGAMVVGPANQRNKS